MIRSESMTIKPDPRFTRLVTGTIHLGDDFVSIDVKALPSADCFHHALLPQEFRGPACQFGETFAVAFEAPEFFVGLIGEAHSLHHMGVCV